jgi:lauroyl/myristoyl acyltransferase
MNDDRVTEREVSDWLRAGRGFSSGDVSRSIRILRSLIDIQRMLFSLVASMDIRLALAAADILGRASSQLSIFGPSSDEIISFLGENHRLNCRGISGEITASAAKNMVLRSFVRRKGLEGLAPFIRISGAEYLFHLHEKKLPAVFVFGHNGPILGIPAAFYSLNIPVLVVRRESPVPYPVPPNIDYCFTEAGLKGRTMALKLAIDRLRSGGFVLLAMWGKASSNKDAFQFLGRNTYFAPGFALAARVSGAAVIPVSSRWAQGRKCINIHFHDSLPQPDCSPESADIFDRSLVKEAAQWLEAGLRSMPGQIQVKQMRYYLKGYG